MREAFDAGLPSWLGGTATRCTPDGHMADHWQRHLPSLADEPQLASLAALDAAIMLVTDALKARHAELTQRYLDDYLDIQVYCARDIIDLAESLFDLTHRYRTALISASAQRLDRHCGDDDF